VRENESKRGKDDMDLPWSSKSNVAVFGAAILKVPVWAKLTI
jgi:hypothetical protein